MLPVPFEFFLSILFGRFPWTMYWYHEVPVRHFWWRRKVMLLSKRGRLLLFVIGEQVKLSVDSDFVLFTTSPPLFDFFPHDVFCSLWFVIWAHMRHHCLEDSLKNSGERTVATEWTFNHERERTSIYWTKSRGGFGKIRGAFPLLLYRVQVAGLERWYSRSLSTLCRTMKKWVVELDELYQWGTCTRILVLYRTYLRVPIIVHFQRADNHNSV